jgi:hypothetical protein
MGVLQFTAGRRHALVRPQPDVTVDLLLPTSHPGNYEAVPLGSDPNRKTWPSGSRSCIS